MKRTISTIFVFILAMMIVIPGINAQAKIIKSLEVSQSDGKINVNGTAEEGTYAVAIMVYDEAEKNLITMQTTSVNNDNSYSGTLTVKSGNYVIKVADYEGGEYVKKSITTSTSSSEASNPKTGDNIILSVIILLLSLVGITAGILYAKKNKLIKSK